MRHKYIVPLIITILCILFILLCILLATPGHAYEGEAVRTRKQEALHEAADILRNAGFADDSDAIKALSAAWYQEQENLDIVAKVIDNEATPLWCDWEHSVAVGAVVVNRVNSSYFPNSVKEVVNAPGQYLPAYTRNFEKTSRLSYLAAKAALDGNHEVPSNAYWQDNKRQGIYTWKEFVLDTGYFKSTTHIC